MNVEMPKRYPIGVQAFEEVRTDFEGYVDKTVYVYQLAHGAGKHYFLSRPRRFGKSLLISTMQSYFEGRRDLFEGLAIDALETEWEESPVLRIDLNMVKTQDFDALNKHLLALLADQEDRFGIEHRTDGTLGTRFGSLLAQIHEITGKRAVVLVDEYDAPLLSVVDNPEKLETFRQVMREFYIPLKSCDEHLRFVFLTGITKFSQLSIFSEEELTSQLAEDVEMLASRMGVSPSDALAQLKDHYDGYHFTDESPDMYNPFSLLNAFATGRIDSYWFGSGTPTHLISLVKSYGWQLSDLEECEADESEFDAPTEQLDTPLPMLYQAGYLTIKHYDRVSRTYTLGIPNREVSQGLSEGLVRHAAQGALRAHNIFLRSFAKHLRAGEMEPALQDMRAYLAGIPYHLGSKDERGFQTTLFPVFDLLGARIQTEFKTATGRVDAVVETPDTIFVMEFKYGKSAQEALAQIGAKGYMVPFSARGKRLVKVGVNFSPETRTIEDWIIEEA